MNTEEGPTRIRERKLVPVVDRIRRVVEAAKAWAAIPRHRAWDAEYRLREAVRKLEEGRR